MRDTIEFYHNNAMIAHVESSIVPHVGAYISIRQRTYKVDSKSYALDFEDEMHQRKMRVNVELKEI